MSSSSLRLSRRQVLGLAAGGAVGAVGLRTLALHLGNQTVASAAGANGSWNSPLGDSHALAAHLLRRAGFGHSQAELDAAASMSYADLVESLLHQKPDPLPLNQKEPTGYLAVTTDWYRHMATTASQYPERMTLFWHGHFTSDFRKGGRTGPLVWQQNQLFRSLGRSDLRTLLNAVTFDPLMINYLDLLQSTGDKPNENYSREVMELYTLGPGNYTEDDVRQGALALSGIRVAIVDASGNPVPAPRRRSAATKDVQAFYAQIDQLARDGAVWKGGLVPRLHSNATKTYLGRTGNLGPEEVIDQILGQDACAPFIANKALQYFSVPNPDAGYVARVAAAFRSSGYDITTLMRTIFTSDEFKAQSNYRSLVRSPADYMVATMRAIALPDLAGSAVKAGQVMDQILYDPPTVGGWPVNGGWVSSSSWLARVNFAALTVQTAKSLPAPAAAVKSQLDGVVGNDTAAVYNASGNDADRWYAILSSPEFHLK